MSNNRFTFETSQAHTQCISEEQKVQGRLFRPKPAAGSRPTPAKTDLKRKKEEESSSSSSSSSSESSSSDEDSKKKEKEKSTFVRLACIASSHKIIYGILQL
eukprot:TRINITY_DN12582_c0_g2_i3.p2 TRINITY_DN12582_c0_g2~~TRINITY_DN12582_c0_g2_i3.p2  ORF type:complete len:102 (-),score=32.40 TRINITY_DN12582_c0_g2_i3:127-432(-)